MDAVEESLSGANAGAMPALRQFLPQTCNCGLIRAKDLPPRSVWTSAGDSRLTTSVSPDGGTLSVTALATSPTAAVPSTLRAMDSFGAKRLMLQCVANLLSNLIAVGDVI